ncbi:Holliday junction DNA helicase RuvA [Fervidicella metallireducens AeB]|uniref:Holliday junction branch migration complex subunit RuvA n=1 Tax=Fervidicella metallireducens AeB TaxID=1403537 RepID=A0A017S0C6_9CLOT|nr:Holliday junction branch migration protein RuvA [Fervidicella metallireducens]EYE89620.1 Holliday junction DNA helicase RuvA [Fervidicella metallireducens AeB]
MIAFVRGIVEEYGEDFVVLDNNGVGYLISMPVSEIEKLKQQKGIIKIHTYHYVREDNIGLYGFLDKEALSIFKLLINVSGVGPKAALSMLSSSTPQSLILAIITDDEKTLCKAQGVGKKLAQRIILELKDKFKDYDFIKEKEVITSRTDEGVEAIGALMALGYTRQEAAAAISKVDTDKGIEEIVKQALKVLMKG